MPTTAKFDTSMGAFTVRLLPDHAPVTVANFVDLATGKRIDGPGPIPSETHIHTEIFKARPDVESVTHCHPHYATLYGLLGRPIVPFIGRGSHDQFYGTGPIGAAIPTWMRGRVFFDPLLRSDPPPNYARG